MSVEQIKRAQFEAVLRLAVRENFEREMKSIPPREELEKMYTFSERHEKRMKKLFARQRRKDAFKTIRKVSYRVAAILIVVVSLTFGALMFNSEVRAAVGRVLVEWFDVFTRFSFPNDVQIDEGRSWKPSYLPTGFELHDAFVGVAFTAKDFQNEDNIAISFTYAVAGQITFGVDNENRTYSIRYVDGVDYHVFMSIADGVQSAITWEYDGFMFLIESHYDVDELFEIAVSVR